MERSIVVAIAACLAACGAHKGAESPKTEPARLVKRQSIALASQPAGSSSHVFMAATDERGNVLNYPVGDVPGTCASIAADGVDLVTLECTTAAGASAGSVRVHAIQQGQDVVVLRETIARGGAPDAMNRDEIGRFAMPVDAKIEASK
jgi:hypothetical protein